MQARQSSLTRKLPLAGLLAALALIPQISRAQEPPPGASRLGHIEGSVSIQPAGLDSWEQADNNFPINPGDRVFADPASNGRGEIQAGPARAYLGLGADVTLTDFSSNGVEFGIAAGTAYFNSDGLPPGQNFFISTPNGSITLLGRTGVRIDVYPDQGSTVVTNANVGGAIQLNGAGGFFTTLQASQVIQLAGTNPVFAQPLMPVQLDEFGHWAGAIETHRFNAVALRYVNPGMIGYADLDNAGDWQGDSPYGPVWFPRVNAGWAPYRNGHWVNRPYYGWVWVADEPWGTAPFHYGRWVTVGGRWGWIPGPREVAPIWSPAQVVFAGGISVGGAGLSVWFPLGPGEPYKPWYPCPPHYIDQINISNIHPGPQVVVQKTYVNIVNVTNVTNITYVNRTVGVTAMNQQDFAAGRPAARTAVKIDVNLVQHVQPAAPAVKPPAQPILVHPVSRPAAVQAARPVLINHQGQQVAAAPHAKPVAVAVKAAPPAPKALPGRQATGTATLGNKPAPPAMQQKATAPAPAAGKPGAPAPAAGKTAPLAAQPAAAKPGTPAQPAKSAEAARPGTPAAQPKTAPAPTTPAARQQPAAPAAKPGTPAAKSASPSEKPAAPGAKPQAAPAAKPGTPAAKPLPPGAKPNTVTPPAKPGEKPNPKDKKKDQKTRDKEEDKKPE